jgi:thiosulfate/3-mercaptopyruvate sulfurtransferase
VLELVRGRKRGVLLDARSATRFRGEEEPIDPVAGHVPGAVNLPHAGSVAEDGRFKSPKDLRQRFEQALGGLRPEQAICMCGSGVTACQSLLAMEAAGLHGARLYAGSWSEWIRDATRPVARGS